MTGNKEAEPCRWEGDLEMEGDRMGRKWMNIQYVHVLTAHGVCMHYVFQTCTNLFYYLFNLFFGTMDRSLARDQSLAHVTNLKTRDKKLFEVRKYLL